jgi:hypothetical protein
MKNYVLLSVLLLSLSQIAVAKPKPTLPTIKEGLWEITFTSNTAAMPMNLPSMTYTSQQCLTQEKAGDPHTFLQNDQCDILNLNQQADLLSWDMRCNQKGVAVTGDGKVSYEAESFTGVYSSNTQNDNASSMKTIIQTSGRYLGSCK